jgi:hypothetical protein
MKEFLHPLLLFPEFFAIQVKISATEFGTDVGCDPLGFGQ